MTLGMNEQDQIAIENMLPTLCKITKEGNQVKCTFDKSEDDNIQATKARITKLFFENLNLIIKGSGKYEGNVLTFQTQNATPVKKKILMK